MNTFFEFALLMALATTIAIIMRLLKQPLIIGHIITGLIAGSFFFAILPSMEVLHLFSEIGIAILLFLVGLHLHPDNIRQFGKVSVITGVGQVLFTSLVGFGVALLLNFPVLTAIYVSVAYAFSSTIIILKLIQDKGDVDALYGRISIGFLLVQDFIAILILFLLPLVASGNFSLVNIAILFARATILLIIAYIVAQYIIPRIGRFFERSHELLFIFTITWGLLVAGIFGITGFGIESGALIAGITLAGMPSRHEINARLTPLRDFFIIMFFVILGAQMNLGNILELLPLALIFSALILIGNPLILMSIMGPLGYKKKTSLQTGFTVAQISEFSLIVIALGVRIGHVSETILSLSTLVALITIFGSTYLITYSDQIYVFLEKYLDIFERKNVQAETPLSTSPEIILFGAGRIGQEFVHHFNERNLSYLAVDHNPDIIAELSAAGAHAIHADAGSIAFLESLLVEKTRMIIITTPEIETSLTISTALREAQPTCLIIGVAAHHRDAQTLYTAGYDYVITPYALGAHHATEIFGSYGFNKESYAYMRSAHQKHLERFYREPIV